MPACLRAGKTTSSGGKRDNRKGQGYSADILVIRGRLGRAGVERQIRATVNKAVAEAEQRQSRGKAEATARAAAGIPTATETAAHTARCAYLKRSRTMHTTQHTEPEER